MNKNRDCAVPNSCCCRCYSGSRLLQAAAVLVLVLVLVLPCCWSACASIVVLVGRELQLRCRRRRRRWPTLEQEAAIVAVIPDDVRRHLHHCHQSQQHCRRPEVTSPVCSVPPPRVLSSVRTRSQTLTLSSRRMPWASGTHSSTWTSSCPCPRCRPCPRSTRLSFRDAASPFATSRWPWGALLPRWLLLIPADAAAASVPATRRWTRRVPPSGRQSLTEQPPCWCLEWRCPVGPGATRRRSTGPGATGPSSSERWQARCREAAAQCSESLA